MPTSIISRLETERLNLIPPSTESLALYLQFYLDGEASAMYGGPLTAEQTWARLKADVGSWFLLGFGVWVLQQKSDGKLIGTCGFWKGKDWPTELTWWVLPQARGLGYATEASKAALIHAYEEFNWPKVETYMNDNNGAALALVKKLKGKQVRRSRFPDGMSRNIYNLPKPE